MNTVKSNKKVLIVGDEAISSRTRKIVEELGNKNIEVVKVKDLKENGSSLNNIIIDNSDLINEQIQIREQLSQQEPYLIRNYHEPIDDIYVTDHKIKRTDEQRLKEYGIILLDKLLEECILISNKQSKLPRSIRDIIVRTSIEAFKELNVKAEEIKKEKEKILTSLDKVLDDDRIKMKDNSYQKLKESLENNTKEDDRQEQ